MKSFLILCAMAILIHGRSASGRHVQASNRCMNMWDDGCTNGQLPGSGLDNDFMNGGFNPGKRCINLWDDGCANGQLPGSGRDDDFNNGGFNPGKRCVGEDCNDNFNPGKGGIYNQWQIIYNWLSKINRNKNN